MRVGNRTSIAIWADPWLLDKQSGYLSTSVLPNLQLAKVSSLFMENAKQWDKDIILDLFNQGDANLILSIPLSQRSVSDSWF